MYGASSYPTNDDPLAEATNMFINTHTERDMIQCNLEAEKDKIDKINVFFQCNDDVVDEFMKSLDSIDSAFSVYSVYNQDVERRGELVIDGALYPTGPVKDKSWKSVINDKA